MATGKGISFPKALRILELLQQGKSSKEAAYEAEVHISTVTIARKMFPLFLGLPRKYEEK